MESNQFYHEVTLIYGTKIYFGKLRKQWAASESGLVDAGVEPDSLVGFTTPLFLP